MLAGGITGMVAAFLQTLEKLTLLQNKSAVLYCNINAIFSCTNVLKSWQASVFGFPNSIMCLVLFTIFASIALAGLTAKQLPKGLRLGIQALSLLTLGFALWFLWESIYVINAVCMFCLICFVGLLLVNGAWLRLNAADLPVGKQLSTALQRAIAKNFDVLGWVVLASILVLAIAQKFY
jgi:uncharacterized membrane protein